VPIPCQKGPKDLSYESETDELASKNAEAKNVPYAIASSHTAKDKPEKSLPLYGKKKSIDALSLEELLAEIKTSVDDKRYGDIVALMVNLVSQEVEEKKFALPAEALSTLSAHVDYISYRSLERERIALKGIREMASDPLLEYLMERLCHSDRSEEISSILLKLGEKVFDKLLDALEGTEEMRSRKIIAGIIEKFGKSVSKKVIGRLRDPRWFVARNMVAILGQIGDSNSIVALGGMIDHNEARVRKEAVKALSKCGGRESAMLLVEKFDSADEELQKIIIFSLGIMDESVALPTLLKVIRKRSFFAAGPELRKEAIHALGKLQMKGGVGALEEILISKNIFKKEREDLRLASAESLACIGDERSLYALRKGSLSGNVEVRKTCIRLMARLSQGG